MQSKAWQEMVEVGGRICQVLGLPRSTGQIFGLLYLSTEPLSLNKMSAMLGISKASASTGTRQLAAWGAIRKVWVPGERRDYYEVVEDLGTTDTRKLQQPHQTKATILQGQVSHAEGQSKRGHPIWGYSARKKRGA